MLLAGFIYIHLLSAAARRSGRVPGCFCMIYLGLEAEYLVNVDAFKEGYDNVRCDDDDNGKETKLH